MLNLKLIFLICMLLLNSIVFANNGIPQESDQQIRDFSLVGFGEKGVKTWDLAGRSADISTDLIKLKDITGNFYGQSDNVNLSAEKGDFNRKDSFLHLEKNVVITTSSGTKLTTDSLDWDKKKQLVSTKDIVNIQKENLAAVASGATSQPDLNKVTLQKDVTVELNQLKPEDLAQPDPKDKIIITCDGPVEIDYAESIARFNKNVKVENKDLLIYSDTMDIYFSQSAGGNKSSDLTPSVMANKIQKIVSRGNVKIVRGENVSYSAEAVYSASDKKIILSGAPKLILYSTEDMHASFGN